VSSLLPYLVSGLVAGSLYGLAGLGLVLTYRTSGVFNFGHGAVAAGGAFLFYTLHVTAGIPWPIAGLMAVLLFAFVLGPVLEYLTRSLANAPDALIVIGTVGVLLVVEGLLYLIYGDATRSTPEFLPTSGFQLGGVLISWGQVISVAVSATGAAGLYLFLKRARLGVSMRAVVDNPRLVSLSGDKPDRVRRAGWAMGCGVAAIAGILLAPTLNLDVNLLTLLVVQAFGACAIGMFSSLPLTFVGGLVIGVLASFATKYLTSPHLTGVPPTVPFLVLIGVLLAAKAGSLPGSRAGRQVLVSTPPRMTARAKAIGGVVSGAALLAVPFVVGTKLPVWTTALAYVVVFASLSLLTWGSGQISLCHSAFLAVGATTMAHLTKAGVPWLAALLIAGLAVVPLGAMVAIPAIRLSGLYLALATLGFGIFLQNVIYPSGLMFSTALSVQLPRPRIGPIDATSNRTLYFVMLAIVVVLVAGILAIQRGRFGRLLAALAESPTMLATHGLGLSLTRLLVFCLSAFFAGISGALVITQTGAASGVTFGPIQSLLFLCVLGVSGTTRLRSPAIAAVLFAVVPGYVTGFGADRQILAFGALALLAAVLLARRNSMAASIGRRAASSDQRRHRSPVPPRAGSVPRAALQDTRVVVAGALGAAQ
jgi:branched-subunit amino acid ABC-type transport system permease component